MEIIKDVLLSTAGMGVVFLIIARIVPNAKLRGYGVILGKKASAYGGKKLGKAAWRHVELFLQNSVSVFLEGVKEGLNADDAEETNEPAKTA